MKTLPRQTQPFWLACASMLVYFLALPPARLSYAIFLVPALWRALIVPKRRFEPVARDSTKRRAFRSRLASLFFGGEFRQYWFASLLFWLATVSWVRYPHPATALGWIALACYLAFYFPFFISASRALVRYLRLPTPCAAAVAWVATEYWRNRMLGGFSFAGLSHAIYDELYLTQIAEPLGEYGVGAMIVVVGTLLGAAFDERLLARRYGTIAAPPVAVDTAESLDERRRARRADHGRRSVRYLSFALLTILLTCIYGYSRVERLSELEQESRARGAVPLRLALLQDGETYRFPLPKEKNREISQRYVALAFEASRARNYDAIIWPEGCHAIFFFDTPRDLSKLTAAPSFVELDPELAREFPEFAKLDPDTRAVVGEDLAKTRRAIADQRRDLANMTARLGTAAILGSETVEIKEDGNFTCYNSAILAPYVGSTEYVDARPDEFWSRVPTDETRDDVEYDFRRYDKTKLVLFGEYIPFLDYLPESWGIRAVCAIMPLGRGRSATAFTVRSRENAAVHFTLMPHVCFESSIPQFIKSQFRELRANDLDPDVIVNISNDGWFRNGMQTDMHLATMVYRAIENRRSLVTATHGGFSAWIDPTGRVRSCGARGKSEVVDAEIYVVKARSQGRLRLGGGECDLAESGSFLLCALTTLLWLINWSQNVLRRRRDRRAAKLAVAVNSNGETK